MNMSGTFTQDFAHGRPVAQHCSELTWRGPRADEREAAILSWKRDLAGELAAELGQLLQGDKLDVSISDPQTITGEQVFEKIGPVAANTLVRIGSGNLTALISLDYATAIALTDCSFGGEGAMPDAVPSQLPRSAGLLVEQFAGSIAQVIAMAKGAGEPARGDVLVRSESAVRLKPFNADAQIAVLNVTLAQGAFAQWQMMIALAYERLDELLPKSRSNGAGARAGAGPSGAKSPDPYAGVPLKLEAVLTEFEMSLGKLEGLSPGDEIALTIPRELPLRIGEDVFAHGALGTVENHLALRLTKVPHRLAADSLIGGRS